MRTLPPTGGSPTDHGAGVFRLITPDSERLAYTRIVSDALGTTELFSAQIFGGDERDLSGLGGAGYVGDTAVSADRAWIVYSVQVGREGSNASQCYGSRFLVLGSWFSVLLGLL